MSARTVMTAALVLTACSFGAARAQTPSKGYSPLDTLPAPASVPQAPTGLAAQPSAPLPSAYVRGDKYQCCDSVGGSGPLFYELFFRVGPSIPIGHNGQLQDVLQTGLYLGGGARLLLFDCDMEGAWTFELGLANITNHAHGTNNPIALDILVPDANGTGTRVFLGRDAGTNGVTVSTVNRTFVDLGPGREWYLWGSAQNCQGPSWRVGFDAGGRYGSESATFHEIRHRTDVIAGLYAAAHTDLEIPCGHCIFQIGFRLEWGYTWSDILQIQNNSDQEDLNLLFNVGIRF
jgi:hypothetical protein